jgi:DNA-binding protein HU-beta
MAVFISPAMLRRMIADKSGVPLATVEAVLDAHDEVVLACLETGLKVRALGVGHFAMKDQAAMRKFIPVSGQVVDIPAKRVIVFKAARKP